MPYTPYESRLISNGRIARCSRRRVGGSISKGVSASPVSLSTTGRFQVRTTEVCSLPLSFSLSLCLPANVSATDQSRYRDILREQQSCDRGSRSRAQRRPHRNHSLPRIHPPLPLGTNSASSTIGDPHAISGSVKLS